MRAPPESLSPTIGAPTFMARSITLQIFWAHAAPSEPPKTVKSWAKTKSFRPSTVPCPVTTPSPRTFCSSMPNSVHRCVTKRPISTNEPGSRSRSMRSRAVSLPASCCFLTRSAPPPSRARALVASRRVMAAAAVCEGGGLVLGFVGVAMGSRSPRLACEAGGRGGGVLERRIDVTDFFPPERPQRGPARAARDDVVGQQRDLAAAAGRVADELGQRDAREAALELGHDVDAALERSPHVARSAHGV